MKKSHHEHRKPRQAKRLKNEKPIVPAASVAQWSCWARPTPLADLRRMMKETQMYGERIG